jgi:hypothetical protein
LIPTVPFRFPAAQVKHLPMLDLQADLSLPQLIPAVPFGFPLSQVKHLPGVDP